MERKTVILIYFLGCPIFIYSQDEEEEVDERAPSMGAKSLCRPFEQPTENPIIPGVTKCPACGHDAKHFMLFGRSY
jgi:prolyl-tRNA synthetase